MGGGELTNSPCIGQSWTASYRILTEAAVPGPGIEKGAVVHDSRRRKREGKRNRERLAGDSRNESASSDHLFVSQLVNHVNIKPKNKEKKKATKLIDWQKKRKKRRSATDINKYAFQDLIGLKQTSKQAV